MITQARLIELFEYSPKWGYFTRLSDSRTMKSVNQMGAVTIFIDGELHLAHRMAWLYVYGELPKKHITHIDGDKTNNSINNLVLSDSPLAIEKRRQQLMTIIESETPEQAWQRRYNARMGKLTAVGYKIHGNHMVKQNSEHERTYLLMYDQYIRKGMGENS
jgi:hypothetical protein